MVAVRLAHSYWSRLKRMQVFTSKAPARLPGARSVDRLGLDPGFVHAEVAAMGVGCFAATASRSVLGSMNEFSFLADAYRRQDAAPGRGG